MVEHHPHFHMITALFWLDAEQFGCPPFTIGLKLRLLVSAFQLLNLFNDNYFGALLHSNITETRFLPTDKICGHQVTTF